MSELPPMALLDAASRALGSARYAAQPRNFLDRWWAALFPKRTRRIEQQFRALELLIQQFSAAVAHQHQQIAALQRESTRLTQAQTAMLQAVIARLQAGESRTAQLEHAAQHEFASQASVAQLAQSQQQAAEMLATLQPLPGQLIVERQRLSAVLLALEQLQSAQRDSLRQTFASIEALRSVEAAQTRKLEQLSQASIHSAELLGRLSGQTIDDGSFARFYLAFEDRYRGSEAEITERLRIYLPTVVEVGAPPDLPVLDLGCGRGEMLRLLREAGLKAIGVDTNEEMLKRCRAAGLEVVSADAIAYLAGLPRASCRAITSFHLIEHLPFPKLLELLREALRVLTPGGVLIMETPSCHNLLVSATTFHSDPTHNHPLPATLMSFALEHTGFAPIEVRFLHPYPEGMKLAETSEEAKRFNEYFYGAQDYALIARRPSA